MNCSSDVLQAYLDDELEMAQRLAIEDHISECPNCWVICDTTKKTIQIYRGMDPYPIPSDMHTRLMSALELKMARKT